MRKIFYLGLWCFVIILSIGVLYTRYVFSDLNQSINKKAVNLIIEEIQSTRYYDEFVYNTYNQVYDNALEKSFWNRFANDLKGEIKECPCYSVAGMASPIVTIYSNHHFASPQLDKTCFSFNGNNNYSFHPFCFNFRTPTIFFIIHLP